MKFKVFFIVLLASAAIFLATNHLFIGQTEKTTRQSLKESVGRATSLYKHINRANTLEKIRKAEKLSTRKELLEAFDVEKYRETPEDVSDNVQVELNIINKLYDRSDIIFVTDAEGSVVARNLEDTMKAFNFGENTLIKNALSGRSDEDILKILGKPYKVVTVPLRKDSKIIGTISVANNIDSEMAKTDFSTLTAETNGERNRLPLYFAFLGKKKLLGSNAPTELHEGLKRYIERSSGVIEGAFNESERVQAFEMNINGETFYANLAVHPQIGSEKEVAFLILSSVDMALAPIVGAKNNFTLFVAIVLLLGFIGAYFIEESFLAPINRFMEGMIEIINGNKKFRFDNEADGIEGNLNQNANYMISVLLGEKIPESPESDKETMEEKSVSSFNNLNKVILIGRLGRDPELKYAQSGTAIANFSVATSESVRRGDSWEEKTEWHNVVVFSSTAEHCSKYLKKGSLVYVEGRLQTRSYQDRDGNDRYRTEIIAQSVKFLDSRDAAQGAGAGYAGERTYQQSAKPQTAEPKKNVNEALVIDADEDDDLPF